MKKSIKIIIALAIILFASLGIIVGLSDRKPDITKIKIVATNFPAYDFARAVAGDTAEIKMLISPGAEVHDFEPTPQDIIDIEDSDLFIYNGGESDAWLADILNDINPEQTKVFKMMDSANLVKEDAHAEEDEYDEHIWTSLRNATTIINNIKDELIKISPENQEIFTKNTEDYTAQLANLDTKFQKIVDSGKRKTIVFGDRFPLQYFVNDYGLEYYAAFPGCSEQTEASSETIASLINKIKTNKIPVVFKIELSNGQTAETISKETGAKVLTFNSAHNISADDFKSGRTYLDIMTDNRAALEEALK